MAGMRFCGTCGHAVTGADAGQRRHVTVMFCDLVGSTPLAERLDPEDLRDVIVAYQVVCADATERFGGFTAKYMGDGLLVYFGYPTAHEDDPHRSIHAALGIVEGVAKLNRDRLERSFGVSLQVRIGIHSGLVVAGEMGGGKTREEYAIVGEVPNVAARLEAAAQPGTILISAETQRLVAGYFETEPLGMLSLKGVSSPTMASQVIRATGIVNRLEISERGRLAPFVGRQPELSQLLDRWNGVVQGQGAIAHIWGQAGIGKSRITRAVREHLRGQGTSQVWQCSPHHQNTALHPVIRYIEHAVGLDRSASSDSQSGALREALVRVGINDDAVLPLLANLLSVDVEVDGGLRHDERSSLDIRATTLEVLEAVLVRRADQYPLLLIVEDLHWADPTTLDLLGRIVADIASSRVFAIFTFRPDFEPPWDTMADIVSLPIAPMTSDQLSQLVTAASRGVAISDEVRARVIANADGVPLFAEEMARMLVVGWAEESGRTEVNRGHDGAAAMAGLIAVPPTLQGLLTARLDQLQGAREIAQVASVLGREFALDVLQAVSPVSPVELRLAVDQLLRDNIIRSVRGSGPRYEFRHALLHDAAYESLLKRSRQSHHDNAAQAIVDRFPSLAEREPETVAAHYTRAGRHDAAIQFWRAAGMRALASASFAEAADHFGNAVEAVDLSKSAADRVELLIELLSHLATSRQAAFGYASTGIEEPYERARAMCMATGNASALVPIIRGLWIHHHVGADYSSALKLGHEMLGLGLSSKDDEQLVEGHLYIGMVHMYLARFEQARASFEQAISLYRRPAHPSLIYGAQGDSGVMAHAYLAPVLWNLGEAEAAQMHSDESLALADAIGEPMTFAQAWGMRTLFHAGRKEPKLMAIWAAKTREYTADRNIAYWLHLSSILERWLDSRNDLAVGIVKFRESYEAYLATGARLGLPDFAHLLAGLHLAADVPAIGLEVLHAAEAHISNTGEAIAHPDILRSKGHLLLALRPGDPDAAQIVFERAIAVALGSNALIPALRASVDLARLHLRGANTAGAHEVLSTIISRFAAGLDIPELRQARTMLAELGAAINVSVESFDGVT